VSVVSAAATRSGITDAIRGLVAAATPYVEKEIWTYYLANKDRVLFTKKILWFSFSIKVSDFEGLIEELAGPQPQE